MSKSEPIPNTGNAEDLPSAISSNVSLKKKALKKSETIKLKYPMVEVLWDDAAGLRHGWEDKVEKLEPMLVCSVGFLIFENPDHIIIAMDLDGEGQHNGRSQIPKGMMRQMKVIRKANAQVKA